MKTEALKGTVVLVPAYNPDGKLTALLDELGKLGVRVVVVDDGSEKGREVFEAARERGIPVVAHARNRGKGAALKTGFKWILENCADCRSVVTADADGQHRPGDIARVAVASLGHPGGLTLGVRSFTGKVPLRSRFGNWWTRQFFFLATRLRIGDTQTGLRGIPAGLLQEMLALPGERYEYEMRMLADARRHAAPPLQIPIETVYIEENASSHFNPLRDSIRIYGALLKFCISSVACFLIDNAVFTLVFVAATNATQCKRATCVLVAMVAARALSASANYLFNRVVVFRSDASRVASFAKYWLLAGAIMLGGYVCTAALSRLFDARGLAVTCIKIVVETALFFVSYGVQKRWIFGATARDAQSGAEI